MDFAPQTEIPGIPEAQIRDTGVIDIINDVQLKYTGADVAGAALFSPTSNLRAGNITYANIFEIYKYPNTLVGVKVTGAELKAYMEWSASYYNTFVPGDINLSFDPNIRGYNYDMFQGVDYKIDVSKPAGKRIVELKFKGKAVKDSDTLKLAVNNYRYGGLKSMGIIKGEPYFSSDPKSLRSYIADYIKENSPIAPKVNNNWKVIGADLNHPLRSYLIGEIKAGRLVLPVSEDGRSFNAKSINAEAMIKAGLIPEKVLKDIEAAKEEKPAQEEKPAKVEKPAQVEKPATETVKEKPVVIATKKYVVQPGDALYKIGLKFKITWRSIAKYNKLSNPYIIYPNQTLLIPSK
jgi:2',3'-cyclic-nucleotide 2'-phosphodiesterase/3'-nucleotidase